MTIRRILNLLVLTMILGGLSVPAASAAETGTRYVTFGVGRAQFAEGVGCRVAPGAVTIREVTRYAGSLGIPFSPNVITNWTDEGARTEDNGRYCTSGGKHIHMSWADLAHNRDEYGGQALTSGRNYLTMVDQTREVQRREACGALADMRERGHYNAWALFAAAMPGDKPGINDEVARNVQACGYTWLRAYGGYGTTTSNVRGNLPPEGYYRSNSVNGGSCPDHWDCTANARQYKDPAEFIEDLRNAPRNSHTIIQIYRIVEGYQPGKWRCDGPASDHMTYATELYCKNDLYRILEAADRLGFVATGPATVARAWGLR